MEHVFNPVMQQSQYTKESSLYMLNVISRKPFNLYIYIYVQTFMVMFMSKYRIWFNGLDESSMVTTTSSGGPMMATIHGLTRSLHVVIFNYFFIH